jgi:hypothetical protein
VVTRQTSPVRGLCACFPRWGSERRRPQVSCAGCMARRGCRPRVAAPHPDGGSLTRATVRAERRQRGPLRPSNLGVPSSRPRQRRGCTGAVRPCGAGSGEGQPTSPGCDDRRRQWGQRGCPSNAQGSGRLAYALLRVHRRSETVIVERAPQVHPVGGQCGVGRPRAAHAWLSHWRLANAVWRFTRSSTARASVWARPVQALPVPGVFSLRARDVGPAGLARQHSTAASENAPVRSALPIWVPEVP